RLRRLHYAAETGKTWIEIELSGEDGQPVLFGLKKMREQRRLGLIGIGNEAHQPFRYQWRFRRESGAPQDSLLGRCAQQMQREINGGALACDVVLQIREESFVT